MQRSPPTILIVDDEPDILQLVSTRLEMAGYRPIAASTGEEGLRAFFQQRPALALVDIDMPGMNGFELCSRIREVSDVPVLFLTALGSETEKVRGFRAGADDYIVKPFGRDELVARVGAALRRASMPTVGESAEVYSDDELTVDFDAHVVTVRGERVGLSPLEFKMLGALVRNAGQVIGVQRLIDLAWGADALETSPESVRVYISYLRSKIERHTRRPQLVQTVRGFGYRYCRPASSADSPAA